MPDRLAMVVDDDRGVAVLLADVLEDMGYTVERAATARIAREKLEGKPCELAIIDCMMPGEPGIVLAREARDRGVAVLLISGAPDAMESLPGLGFPFLTKPFRLAPFVEAVAAALAQRVHSRDLADDLSEPT
jgi:DNA-binding response OmpR family regulator